MAWQTVAIRGSLAVPIGRDGLAVFYRDTIKRFSGQRLRSGFTVPGRVQLAASGLSVAKHNTGATLTD